MNWDKKGEKKKKKKLPSVLSSVLSKKKKKKTTTRVPGPIPTAKPVGTMAQNSVQKKERQCKKKKKIHISKSRRNLEKHKQLEVF